MSEDIKTRWDKLPARIQNLFKRYYLVGGTLVAGGFVLGFIAGKVFGG